MHLFRAGFLVLASHQLSQQTEVVNSNHHCGTILCNCLGANATSYHPIANGLIECFHRQLKTSLKTYPQPASWTDSLPIVLLGIRTQLKDDLQCTTAELVYGTTLRLPGKFFDDIKVGPLPDPISYAAKLKSVMTQLQSTPVRQQQKGNSYVSPHLKSCTHVFVHHDAVKKPLKKPLQKPYDGPFKVIKHSTKHYTLEMNGHNDVVSIDRFKPAFYEL